MEPHILNRQIAVVTSYIAYLENSNKYINVLNVSQLKDKIEEIKKVYRYASDQSQLEHSRICNVSIGQLELNNSKATCRFVIEIVLFDLRQHLAELKRSLAKVDRTVMMPC